MQREYLALAVRSLLHVLPKTDTAAALSRASQLNVNRIVLAVGRLCVALDGLLVGLFDSFREARAEELHGGGHLVRESEL